MIDQVVTTLKNTAHPVAKVFHFSIINTAMIIVHKSLEPQLLLQFEFRYKVPFPTVTICGSGFHMTNVEKKVVFVSERIKVWMKMITTITIIIIKS